MKKNRKTDYSAPELELVPLLLTQCILEVSLGDSYDVVDPVDL